MNGLFVDPVVGWFVLGVYGLLIAASAVVALMVRLRPGVSFTELTLRVKSWWIMVTILALAFLFSRKAAIVFFAFLSFLALKEYFSIIPIRRADRRVLFWAYLAIPLQYYWVAIGWYGMFIIFIPVYMFMFLPMRMIAIGQTSGFLNAIGSIHWGLMILVFSISHLAYLLVLPASTGSGISGPGLVLYLVFLTQFNDVAQYIWGKSLGRHKVVPLVSPNKTWEGLLGGVATTAVLAVALHTWLTPLTRLHALAVGLFIGFGGFIGDVTLSSLKRDLGLKDSGTLLPGHGGILDRVNSLTFTAPVFFHFIRYYYF
jgi:phosphatidate cytidylyltransferase